MSSLRRSKMSGTMSPKPPSHERGTLGLQRVMALPPQPVPRHACQGQIIARQGWRRDEGRKGLIQRREEA